MPGLELVPSHAPHLTLQRTTWVSNDIHFTDKKTENQRNLPACPPRSQNQYSVE